MGQSMPLLLSKVLNTGRTDDMFSKWHFWQAYTANLLLEALPLWSMMGFIAKTVFMENDKDELLLVK